MGREGAREVSEIWKAIPGFEGLYEVSDQGRVRSLDRVVLRHSPYHGGCVPTQRRGRVLAECVTDGYAFVHLYETSVMRRFAVHVLVALAFVGPRPDGLLIRHLDGCKKHNFPTNLAYGTAKENGEDSVKHGTLCHSEAHHKAKLTRNEVLAIRQSRGRERQIDLADKYGVHQSGISAIQLGKTWRHV